MKTERYLFLQKKDKFLHYWTVKTDIQTLVQISIQYAQQPFQKQSFKLTYILNQRQS